MAVCVAVVGKDNSPLLIQTVPMQDELKFHYAVHTSLDVIEEKITSAAKANTDLRELYLGLLYPTEEHKIYGYVTNTKCKFVIVVESNAPPRDNEIRTMFRKLHTSYADMLCNPFYIPGETITSENFLHMVNEMLVDV